jgi:hypothetical protein
MTPQIETDHPVVAACRCVIARADAGKWIDARRERFVLDHGRSYSGAERPRGYRHQRARKQCFMNAASLALDGRGTYVEGFAIRTGTPVLHAWITLDGATAIDPTWPDATACHYFGIAFDEAPAIAKMCRRGTYGMLDPFDDDFLRELMR